MSLIPRFVLLVDGQPQVLEVPTGKPWYEWEHAINQVAKLFPLWKYRRRDELDLQGDYFYSVQWAPVESGPGLYLCRESPGADLKPEPMILPTEDQAPAKPKQLSLLELI